MGLWNRMSTRERAMAATVAVLVLGMLVYASVVPSMNYLERLDEEIADLEWRLLQYTEQAMRKDAVDQAYARIAEVHGSDLSKEEIHDGLRDEIYRLVQRELVPPGQELPGGGDLKQRILVFNELPEGELDEGLEGYREYSINFQTLQVFLVDLMEFLRRVQESPQALRVQNLVFKRPPLDEIPRGIAEIEVARTVVDGVPEEITALLEEEGDSNLIANPGFEEWNAGEKAFPGWQTENAEAQADSRWTTAGDLCAAATTKDGAGSLFQEVELKPGAAYALELDLAATGPVRIGVADDDAPFETVDAVPDGLLRRYRIEFSVPEDSAGGAAKAPFIEIDGTNAEVFVDSVALTRIRG